MVYLLMQRSIRDTILYFDEKINPWYPARSGIGVHLPGTEKATVGGNRP